MNHCFTGLAVSGGIGIGRVHLLDRRRVAYPRLRLPDDSVDEEVERFQAALRASGAQLSELSARAAQAGFRQLETLMEAHATILLDDALRGATIRRIRSEQKNAEWALKETIRGLREAFDQLEFEYFRERRRDVDFVGDRILRNLVGAKVDLLSELPEEAVVVAYELSPADTVMLARHSARAFVTEGGGPTSHTAILAHALNIPSVLGVRGIMHLAALGDEIVVDGDAGVVVLCPDAEEIEVYRGRRVARAQTERVLLEHRDLAAETTDGVKIHVDGNIEVSSEVDSVLGCGGEGIGLYRTEFMALEAPTVLSSQEHFEVYARLVRRLDGRMLTIRTVDVGGDKLLRRRADCADSKDALMRSMPSPLNPALGLRAIRLSLRQESEFKAQIKGVLMASGLGPVRVLLPLVTHLEEIRRARKILDEVMKELEREGVAFDPKIPLGTMIETPGAALVADILAKEADFLSIGTNDLIQYVLAVDRDNDDVTYLYRPCHPGVLRLIRSVVCVGAERDVPVSLCGEMAANPWLLPLLVGLGLRALSMSATSIPLAKHVIRQLSAADCRALVERLLDLPTADEVEEAVRAWSRPWMPGVS
ncbi:MAG: phosphoenolpyruvate--protein phosphotransferase [Deltaproteobacteria bacterium]|nr:phosphoenolpyruvate--protein phosphotransferase [Deltaproteobacteria bacterium]